MERKYTYGPVPSRRLGSSLGVSVIPSKACTYSCVYCQLGRTTRKGSRRESFFSKEEILSEIEDALENKAIDYITFVGDGEPTLSKDLGWLIEECKARWTIPVAVITNGSLLSDAALRRELGRADVVMPSLDAGDAETFRRINRPHRDISFQSVVDGMRRFRTEYRGQLWLEVMLVDGVNDSEANLRAIKSNLTVIKPDRVYVMIPIRPPCVKWVKPPSVQAVLRAQEVLGEVTPVLDPETGRFGVGSYTGAEEAILEISSRHPLRAAQGAEIERTFNSTGTIEHMVQEGLLRLVDFNGERFLMPRSLVKTTGHK